MDSNTNATEQQLHDMLLRHINLPRFLPQKKSANLHQTELLLMHYMVQNVINVNDKIPTQTVQLFKGLWTIHNDSLPNERTVSTEINALRSGHSFGMFVRRQNCMFVIHAPSNHGKTDANTTPAEVIVATFPGNLHPDEVYKYSSDIEVN